MEWRDCLLGDALTLHRGYDLPERDRRTGVVPIVSSSGITGYHNTAKVQGPGVVTGRYGTLGEVFYIAQDFWPLNTTLYVSDFNGNDPLFLSYYLRTLNLSGQNAAGAVPGVNRNHLHLLPARIPPLPLQSKIAGILAAYDELIENNTRRIAILEEMARGLYHEWFVRFRFPGHEGVRIVESALGAIPEGWEVGRLEDALTLQRGFDLPASNRREGSVPVYAASGQHGWHDQAKVEGPGVVLARAGSIGAVTYVHDDFWPLNTTLWVSRFRRVTPIFAYYLLRSLDLAAINSGLAVPMLNRNYAYQLAVSLPPVRLIDLFDVHAMSMFALKRNLEIRNANLRQTRDLLLPRLVSGEVDVEARELEHLFDLVADHVPAGQNN